MADPTTSAAPERCPHCKESLKLPPALVKLRDALSAGLVAAGWSKSSAQEYAAAAIIVLDRHYTFTPKAEAKK